MTKSLAAKHSAGAGLDLAGLGGLAAMLDAPVTSAGEPQMFDIDKIREDLNVRTAGNPGFSEESIRELADSMLVDLRKGGRGIKSPLSLRPDPGNPGIYIINHGHRRYRAARVANLSKVPGFIDEIFDKYDQVIENIQREALTAREIADFIGGELAKGHTQAEIAQRLGRSKAFVSQHAKLLDLPDTVAHAFQSGAVKDVTVANELARAHLENARAVDELIEEKNATGLAAKPIITRSDVKALRSKTSTSSKKKAKLPQAEQKPAKAQCGAKPWLATLAASMSDRVRVPVTITEVTGAPIRMVMEIDDYETLAHVLRTLGLSDLFPQDV